MPATYNQSGFTLLEAIIYIALFSIIFTGIFVSVYPIFTGAERLTANVVAESETAFILSKINYTINNTVTDDSASVSVPNPDELTLTNGSTQYHFEVEENSADYCPPPQQCSQLFLNGVPLNNTRVKITDFTVVENLNPHYLDISFAANTSTTTARYYLRF